METGYVDRCKDCGVAIIHNGSKISDRCPHCYSGEIEPGGRFDTGGTDTNPQTRSGRELNQSDTD